MLFAVFEDLGNTYQYDHILNEPLQAGKRYKINVEAEDFEPVSATLKDFEPVSATLMMPDAPIFDVVNYTNGSDIIIDEKEQDIYEIALQDEAGIDNYYEFKIHTYHKYGFGVWTKKSMYLKDDAFDGETYNIELLSNKRDTTIHNLKVEVIAITRDKYLFIKTLLAYKEAQGNPFAEPVIVHSNIENGQGLFSLQNSTEILIE